MLSTRREITEILDFDCFHTEEAIKDKEEQTGTLEPTDLLWNSTRQMEIDYHGEQEAKQYATRIMCKNMSNSLIEFRELYTQWEIIEVYKIAAISNAIHYTKPKTK